MNWYKSAQQEDASSIISKSDFERRLQMLFNQYREALDYKSWQQWIREDPNGVYLTLDSDADFYRNYMQNVSEDINIRDIVDAYLNGQLKDIPQQPYQYTQMPIERTDIGERTLPWQAEEQKELSVDEAQSLYQLASQRKTKSNEQEVFDARKKILLFYNTDKDLAVKIGIADAELNKRIRSMVGFSVSSKRLHERLNQDIPSEHQWSGMLNSSFIGQNKISPEELDQFVKNIDVSDEGVKSYYYKDNGEMLRRYIAATFMAIDTRLAYDDLSFKIGRFEKSTTNGNYSSQENLITISDININTIAHEIGHYLDYKFSRELYPKAAYGLSEMSIGDIDRFSDMNNISDPKKEWFKKAKSFIEDIRKGGDISSEYTQRPGETFSRFIDRFTSWTNKKAGGYVYDRESYRQDKFSEQDFVTWVRLLQEKSYVDSL